MLSTFASIWPLAISYDHRAAAQPLLPPPAAALAAGCAALDIPLPPQHPRARPGRCPVGCPRAVGTAAPLRGPTRITCGDPGLASAWGLLKSRYATADMHATANRQLQLRRADCIFRNTRTGPGRPHAQTPGTRAARPPQSGAGPATPQASCVHLSWAGFCWGRGPYPEGHHHLGFFLGFCSHISHDGIKFHSQRPLRGCQRALWPINWLSAVVRAPQGTHYR